MTRDANDAVFVILTSKPGVYRTEVDAQAEIVETYDYACDGRTRAVFSIACLRGGRRDCSSPRKPRPTSSTACRPSSWNRSSRSRPRAASWRT